MIDVLRIIWIELHDHDRLTSIELRAVGKVEADAAANTPLGQDSRRGRGIVQLDKLQVTGIQIRIDTNRHIGKNWVVLHFGNDNRTDSRRTVDVTERRTR